LQPKTSFIQKITGDLKDEEDEAERRRDALNKEEEEKADYDNYIRLKQKFEGKDA
jgi:hypothetical protein